MYPKNDDSFEVKIIEKVVPAEEGWEISFVGGWCLWVPPESPVAPQPGMTARLYGKGIGYPVRGLFLDEHQVFYRTASEDKEYRDIEMFGSDAKEWLRRWDDNKTVWTIAVGGIGPGYEQAIHICCAEILRHLLEAKYDITSWADHNLWTIDRNAIEAMGHKNPKIDELGLSGAQWGAALRLAVFLYRDGPRVLMADPKTKDRHILVQRYFPQG